MMQACVANSLLIGLRASCSAHHRAAVPHPSRSLLPQCRFPRRRQRALAHAAAMSKAELYSLPGVTAVPDLATKGYIMQQTMLRIRDPKHSLDFYTRVLGMTLLCKLDFKDMQFTLYFLGYADPAEVPEDPVERARWMFSRPACIELTHNWGTEDDPEFAGYHNGNTDPRGFGHIGITVPNVEAACKRFEDLGVDFVKRPNDGKMKNLAFIKDPDEYWIEILTPDNSPAFLNWEGNKQ